MHFHQPSRRIERQQGRCGFKISLYRRRAALATVALLLVLVSAQGGGFLVHALQLSEVDNDGCFPGLIYGGGKPGDNPDNRPIALRDSAAADSKNPHDCSTCPICQQFLRSLKVYRASPPVLFPNLSIGREHIFPFLDTYPAQEIAPGNVRAPPLTDLI